VTECVTREVEALFAADLEYCVPFNDAAYRD